MHLIRMRFVFRRKTKVDAHISVRNIACYYRFLLNWYNVVKVYFFKKLIIFNLYLLALALTNDSCLSRFILSPSQQIDQGLLTLLTYSMARGYVTAITYKQRLLSLENWIMNRAYRPFTYKPIRNYLLACNTTRFWFQLISWGFDWILV